MPKALTAQERERIDAALKNAAAECMQTLGIRRTTVDELVRRANIPKGTFYLFYEAKELLFARVLFDYHAEVKKNLLQRLSAVPELDAQRFSDIVSALYLEIADSFFPTLMMSGELEQLMRRIQEQMVIQHHKDDEAMLKDISAVLPEKVAQGLPGMSPAFRLLFISVLYRREIGEENFSGTLRLLLRGLAIQLFDESEDTL